MKTPIKPGALNSRIYSFGFMLFCKVTYAPRSKLKLPGTSVFSN